MEFEEQPNYLRSWWNRKTHREERGRRDNSAIRLLTSWFEPRTSHHQEIEPPSADVVQIGEVVYYSNTSLHYTVSLAQLVKIEVIYIMPVCERCGSLHDGTFGSGRFCSRSCANARTHSEATRLKISKGVKSSDAYIRQKQISDLKIEETRKQK